MNKKNLIGFLIVILALGIVFYSWKNQANDGSGAAMGPEGMPAPAVSVTNLKQQTITMTKSLPGRVSAFRQSQVRPQVDGIITERFFEEGGVVDQGQQLYQIDDARYKAALASARADLKSAQSNISAIAARANRYQELVAINAVSQQEYDDAKAQLDQAKAAVEVARAAVEVAQVNLDYTKVYAPITGKIGRTLMTEGALVTANQNEPMAIITQLDPVYVDMQEAALEVVRMRNQIGDKEAPVTLFIGEDNAIPYTYPGKLKFSEVTIDRTTGSVALRAVFPNPDGLLLPGLFVRANVELGEQQTILVPQRATTRTPEGRLSVWVLDENNQAQPKMFTATSAYGDSWIVQDGLSVGDVIIVEGYQKIQPGIKVSPSPWGRGKEQEKAQDDALDNAPQAESQDIDDDFSVTVEESEQNELDVFPYESKDQKDGQE